jgi:hypothetical protein
MVAQRIGKIAQKKFPLAKFTAWFFTIFSSFFQPLVLIEILENHSARRSTLVLDEIMARICWNIHLIKSA